MHAPKLGLTIAAACCLLCAWLWLVARAAPMPGPAGDTVSLAPSSFQSPFRLVGSASCAARACHGGIEPVAGRPVQQNEFTSWIGQDVHAKAYDVLLTERSKKIEARLRASDTQPAVKDWKDAKPHENVVCLNCHVFPNVKTARRQPDRSEEDLTLSGVGCEACHGPAAGWLKPHTLPGWKNLAAKEKFEQGMWPIHEPLDRARRCVTCHVGSTTSDMNHDLIAAGHPRLNFEFTLFMVNMPRHWNDEVIKEPDEGKAWLVGQAVTATAALELLKYRASPPENTPDRPPKPWPEFAEYDCFSCHHDLQGVPNWRQHRKGERPVGALVWNNWYTAMPQSLGNQDLQGSLAKLRQAMRQPVVERQHLLSELPRALRAIGQLRTLETDWDSRRVLGELVKSYDGSKSDWDYDAQLYLAAAALDKDPSAPGIIEEMAKKLSYKAGYDSPKEDLTRGSGNPWSDFDKLVKQLVK